MLTATLDALSTSSGSRARSSAKSRAGAVLKHSRDFNLTRECVLGSSWPPRRRPTTSSRRAEPGSRRRCWFEQDRARPDRVSSRRRCRHDLGCPDRDQRGPADGAAGAQPRAVQRRPAEGGDQAPPTAVIPEIPRNAEPRTGLSMGEHTAIMAKDWGIGRAEQDELAVESHRKLAAAYDTGFLDDLVTPYPGARARPEPAPRHERREAREAEAGVRRRGRHDDRGQLDPAE